MAISISVGNTPKASEAVQAVQALSDSELYYLVSALCDDYGNNVSSTFKAMRILAKSPPRDNESIVGSLRAACKHVNL